jgi:predicted nucleotidyltransferase
VPTAATLERLLRAAGVRLGAVPITTSPSSGIRTLIRKHRDQILDIAARHGATNVRIFGSVARGDSRRGSDLDLLVEMGPRTSLLDQVRLRRALNELLPVDVDVVTKGGLRESDAAIEAESVPL